MKILVIEEWSPAADSLIQDLHAGTAASIEHAHTVNEGLLKIEQKHGGVDIVLYTVPSASSDVIVFPDRVRVAANDALFRCPHFVLLTLAPLALPCAVKCMERQVMYLLRVYPKQIVEMVRVLLWKIRTSKPGPTIRIESHQGRCRFFVCGTSTSEEIIVSEQIGKLLLLLLRGTYTVDALAEELEVLPRTIKKYMRALRIVVEMILGRMNLTQRHSDIVWMRRGPGGTLCGLRANPVWNQPSSL